MHTQSKIEKKNEEKKKTRQNDQTLAAAGPKLPIQHAVLHRGSPEATPPRKERCTSAIVAQL